MAALRRCDWSYAGNYGPYLEYHDKEWGVPLHNDRKLFEFLVLEGMQAGLSWLTILKKRGSYRKAFDNFDARKVARYDGPRAAGLLRNPGIIRNRLKISAAINNAKCFLDVQEEFGSFDRYIWGFVPEGKTKKNKWNSVRQIPAKTPESEAMSRDMIKRGFRFVGPIICYAHMQATGMVNDHITKCFRYKEV